MNYIASLTRSRRSRLESSFGERSEWEGTSRVVVWVSGRGDASLPQRAETFSLGYQWTVTVLPGPMPKKLATLSPTSINSRKPLRPQTARKVMSGW